MRGLKPLKISTDFTIRILGNTAKVECRAISDAAKTYLDKTFNNDPATHNVMDDMITINTWFEPMFIRNISRRNLTYTQI